MKEIKIVEEIRKLAGKPGKGIITGIGDDCAVLKHTRDKYLLWAADMLIQGTHFDIKDAGHEKIGRKAIAVNVSDIAAMGGIPKYVTVSLGLPPKRSLNAVRALYRGMNRICKEYGIKIIGGDVNRSDKLVIDVSIIGIVEKKRLLKRSGANKGDLILVTGPVRNGRKEHLDFVPRLKEARFLSGRFRTTSMIDVSDGIAPDLGRICAESRAGCRVYADSIPLSKGLTLDDALYFGESFELLFTMPVTEANRLFRSMRTGRGDLKYFIIGEITGKNSGLRLIQKEGRSTALKMKAFRHF